MLNVIKQGSSEHQILKLLTESAKKSNPYLPNMSRTLKLLEHARLERFVPKKLSKLFKIKYFKKENPIEIHLIVEQITSNPM